MPPQEDSRAYRYHQMMWLGTHRSKEAERLLGVSGSTVRSWQKRLRVWATRYSGEPIETYHAALNLFFRRRDALDDLKNRKAQQPVAGTFRDAA